ncbi:transporter substrate-binding domain-containing protein [Catellatospora paridis]|uniref:transporter substrate-binding domain-containing protein n=1 Tax=Catellatospora paridis TaxID=1617086 RepID=UPI0012D3A5F5|nr:transporter substrate-binding domain-containing protein [Catellatospora paridis]
MTETSARPRWRPLLTATAVTLTMLLAGAAACGPEGTAPKTVDDLFKKTDVYGQPKIKVGVAEDQPLMGQIVNGRFEGFDIEIARYLAESLGFKGDSRIEWVPLQTEDRENALVSGQVHLVVASYSMTPDREKEIDFAGPYFATKQELLIRTVDRDKIRNLNDLAQPGRETCVVGGSTGERQFTDRALKVYPAATNRECLERLLSGKSHAYSTDETILAGYLSEHPKDLFIVDVPIGANERLGVGVSKQDPELRDLVAFFLRKSYDNGRSTGTSAWLAAYRRTLGPWLGDDTTQPPIDAPDLVDYDEKAQKP